MVNNKDLIKAVFDDDIMKYNKWFFKADWEKAEVVNLETATEVLRIKNIIWNNGTWKNGTWKNGIWKNGIWNNGTWYNGLWKNGLWINGDWEKGTWEDGTWEYGWWHDGTWKGGDWRYGKILNHKNSRYIASNHSPNKCKWSSSYGK